MIEARNFPTPFSIELNSCNEHDEDGVYFTSRRFEQFIGTLKGKIDEDNNKILQEIKDEDNEVALSMLNQLDISNSLNYFTDTILKSFVVSIYSYFEYKLGQFSEISSNHLNKKIRSNTSVSGIEKYNSFLISEIIPELNQFESNFEKIKIWKEVRRLIIHDNSDVNKRKQDLSSFSFLKIENGIFKLLEVEDIRQFLILIENYLKTIIDLINTKYNLITYINF